MINVAITTLTANSKLRYAVGAENTVIECTPGEGTNFPSIYPFYILLAAELIKISARSTDAFTGTRAQFNTTAVAHVAGTAFTLVNASYYGGGPGTQLGEFHSTTAGYGFPLVRASATAAARIYSDDGGAVLYAAGSVPDLRGGLSRLLITADQSGGDVRLWGHMGQLRVYDVNVDDEEAGALCGRLELVQSSETVELQGYGITSGVHGIVATRGSILVDTNHIVAGVAAISDMQGTLTKTGIVAGVYVGIYNAAQWSNGTARTKWKYGLYVDEDSVDGCPIQVGKFVSSAGTGGGFALTLTNSAAMRVYAEVTTDLTVSAMVRSILGRTLINGAITSNAEVFGIVGQLVAKEATLRHDNAAVLGSFEVQGTHVHIDSDGTAGDHIVAAVLGRIGVTITGTTVAADGILAGVAAMSNITDGYVTVTSGGILAGMYVGRFSSTTKQVWDTGVYIDPTACTVPITIGKDADGVPVVIVVGNFADNAASGYGHGSIGLDTTDGLLFYVDGSGNWQPCSTA
jgi:hypothetical protein